MNACVTVPYAADLLEQTATSKAISCSADQEIRRILGDPTLHYPFHNSLPLIHTLSHMIPIHALSHYFSGINFNIILPCTLRFYKWSLSFRFSRQNAECNLSYPCVPHEQPTTKCFISCSVTNGRVGHILKTLSLRTHPQPAFISLLTTAGTRTANTIEKEFSNRDMHTSLTNNLTTKTPHLSKLFKSKAI